MKRLNEHLRAIILSAGLAALAVVAASAILPQSADADHRSRREPLVQCRSQLRSASHELRKAERDLAYYKQAYEQLASRRTDRRADRRTDRRRGRGGDRQRAPRGHAMSRRSFASVQQQFQDAGFSSSRLTLMKRVVRDGKLSVEQLTTLLSICSFDSTRIKIAVMAYPRIVDRENWVAVYGSFSFSSSGRTLDRKLGFRR